MMLDYVYEYQNDKKLKQEAIEKLNKYLDMNEVIEIDNFLFDKKSLNTEILLSKCLKCKNYQGDNCCGGSPYSMPKENRDNLESILIDVVNTLPNNFTKMCVANSENFFTPGGSVTGRGCSDGRCFFSVTTDEGLYKCSIHAYCLENNLDPAKYKPYTCSLFPLFAVRTPEDKIIFFCHSNDTASFSPYWYTLSKRFCVQKDGVMKAYNKQSKNKYYNSLNFEEMQKDGALDSYRPAYIEQKNVLSYFVGKDTYSKLLNEM